MKTKALAILAVVAAMPAIAQDVDYLQLATDSGVCGTGGVSTAVYREDLGGVEVTCNPGTTPVDVADLQLPAGADVTALSPLVGGATPYLLGGGFLALLAGAGGSSSTSDTISN